MKTTPEIITELKPNQIFVFGSNLAGRHGKGAALLARMKFGARQGQGTGLMGQCYGIATKDARMNVLPIEAICTQVHRFLLFANKHQELEFLVTKIGCGLAGYKPKEIRPCFIGIEIPPNVSLPVEFQ